MARKKKKAQEDIVNNSVQQIGYQGTVTITLKHGNRTISTKKYHNSGMPNLFKFLATTVAGNKAPSLRPVKIKLFRYPAADVAQSQVDRYVSPTNFKWATAWDDHSLQPVSASPYVMYDTTPVIKYTKNEQTSTIIDDYHYETIFHFRIPFSYITESGIHLIGLFPDNVIDDSTEVSAYYKLTKDDDEDAWDPMLFDDLTGNYSIVVEWTLSFTNKTVKKDTTTTTQNSGN